MLNILLEIILTNMYTNPTTPHQFDTLSQMYVQTSFEILIMY